MSGKAVELTRKFVCRGCNTTRYTYIGKKLIYNIIIYMILQNTLAGKNVLTVGGAGIQYYL